MRLILLFLFLSTLLNVNIVAATQVTPPVNIAPSLPNTQNNHDFVYQQLFSMHSQLASLDEKLQQQKILGNDVKTLEAAQQALTIQLSRFQSQLEAQDKLQASQFTGFDGRISDIASNTNIWGGIFTFFGLIITVAAIALGFSAKNRAVYEAKLAANTASDSHMLQWLEDNKGKLISETKVELEKVSLELKDRAEKLAAEARAALSKIEHDLIEESKRIVTSNTGEADKGLNKHNKPPTGASAKSWFKVGLSAFENNEYDEALKAWAKVLKLLDQKEEPELYAITLMNQGFTYGKQEKFEDALNSYAALIEQFKGSANEEIQIQLAMAMLNQGVTYGKQERFEDALNSYASLIEQFKGSLNEEIQIPVASAMFNQSAVYGLKKDFPTALKPHSMLLETFHSSENSEIRNIIADSKASIAELALLYEAPEQVLNRVAEAEKNSEDPQNLAVMQFIRFLLNDKTIEEVFAALTAIPAEMELEWGFREIKDYLANFEGEKLHQIQAVVSFFEQHKDIEKLRIELGLKS
ncbi:tetratricopeptide repeat protein [Pseudoalteromonas sp. 1_2015MBL_MicDiv]|uniref:tetratricopeptide repeat protein n=1 Tax=Pseudoalteromonas sp. 1_2015MBL_MicDiv TaxID=1720343 RepID=UPI000BBF2ADD|nr:tetratricopeptide repeat protein [Pseudoalteromonas sp. 1_2015MBL_MicDiv]ATG79134.1 hypothetical protein AOR04_17165 [Pseudoalteromonas sp. 1_2015MBL_MicDiv]